MSQETYIVKGIYGLGSYTRRTSNGVTNTADIRQGIEACREDAEHKPATQEKPHTLIEIVWEDFQ